LALPLECDIIDIIDIENLAKMGNMKSCKATGKNSPVIKEFADVAVNFSDLIHTFVKLVMNSKHTTRIARRHLEDVKRHMYVLCDAILPENGKPLSDQDQLDVDLALENMAERIQKLLDHANSSKEESDALSNKIESFEKDVSTKVTIVQGRINAADLTLSKILMNIDKLRKANLEFYSCMNRSIEEASAILSYTDSIKMNLKIRRSLRYRIQNADLCLKTIKSTDEMIECIDCINDIDLSEWIASKSFKPSNTAAESTKSITKVQLK
jgi:hypothetical protein